MFFSFLCYVLTNQLEVKHKTIQKQSMGKHIIFSLNDNKCARINFLVDK